MDIMMEIRPSSRLPSIRTGDLQMARALGFAISARVITQVWGSAAEEPTGLDQMKQAIPAPRSLCTEMDVPELFLPFTAGV
jgi:hypothetical protein